MKTSRHVGWFLVCVVALAVTGCDKPDATPTRGGTAPASTQSPSSGNTTPAAANPQATLELYKGRCSPCHGDSGHGDGPGSAALNPKPRNYSDAAWQDKVTDDEIRKTILYGGAAVGKSPMMPGNPDLEGKPELDGLVKIVRSFKGK